MGLPPDTPDWGIDLARGQDYLRRAWWLITFPGLMVSMVTLSFSMLGESLGRNSQPQIGGVVIMMDTNNKRIHTLKFVISR